MTNISDEFNPHRDVFDRCDYGYRYEFKFGYGHADFRFGFGIKYANSFGDGYGEGYIMLGNGDVGGFEKGDGLGFHCYSLAWRKIG